MFFINDTRFIWIIYIYFHLYLLTVWILKISYLFYFTTFIRYEFTCKFFKWIFFVIKWFWTDRKFSYNQFNFITFFIYVPICQWLTFITKITCVNYSILGLSFNTFIIKNITLFFVSNKSTIFVYIVRYFIFETISTFIFGFFWESWKTWFLSLMLFTFNYFAVILCKLFIITFVV